MDSSYMDSPYTYKNHIFDGYSDTDRILDGYKCEYRYISDIT
jgi:hypothetical protein